MLLAQTAENIQFKKEKEKEKTNVFMQQVIKDQTTKKENGSLRTLNPI